MFIYCRIPGCKAWKKDHDASNSWMPGLCDHHREMERKRNCLPSRRGLTKAFDDYNPRPARVLALHRVKLVIETAAAS